MEIIIARFLGLMIGSNILAVPALLLGLYSWIFQKNMGAKRVVAVAMVLMIAMTFFVFFREVTSSRDGYLQGHT
jgi:hypothetical protein